MTERHGIDLETEDGLKLVGIVDAASIHEAAMMWARCCDKNSSGSSTIAVHDPDYEKKKQKAPVCCAHRSQYSRRLHHDAGSSFHCI